jgi:hypothetical protein
MLLRQVAGTVMQGVVVCGNSSSTSRLDLVLPLLLPLPPWRFLLALFATAGWYLGGLTSGGCTCCGCRELSSIASLLLLALLLFFSCYSGTAAVVAPF